MDYLSFLTDPTVIISIFIAIFSYYIGKLGKLIVSFLQCISSHLAKYLRIKRWQRKQVFYYVATNPHAVTWNIARTYFYLTIFILSMFFYIVFIKIGSFGNVGALPMEVKQFIFSPIYIFEVLWLFQRSYTQDLIKTAGRKKRITRRLSRTSKVWLALRAV